MKGHRSCSISGRTGEIPAAAVNGNVAESEGRALEILRGIYRVTSLIRGRREAGGFLGISNLYKYGTKTKTSYCRGGPVRSHNHLVSGLEEIPFRF